MKAFILAAGLGTRLKPFTNNHPKALAVVNGKTLLERNIQYLQKWGIFDVTINVHHFADQIINTIRENNGFGSRISISDETDAVLETGGGLKKAIPLLKDKAPILMMNVDILSDFNLYKLFQFHLQTNALATLAVQNRSSSRALLFNLEQRLVGWENLQSGITKLPENIKREGLLSAAFSGIQILSQSFFDKIKQEGKFSIIDTYLNLCSDEKIMVWNHTGDLWLDVGKPESLQQAQNLFTA